MTAIASKHDELAALAEIASRATTLDERIRRDRGIEATPDESARVPSRHSLLDAWARSAARGSADLFGRRLAWDGLDPATLPPATPVPYSAHDLPEWLGALREAYGWGSDESGHQLDGSDRAVDPKQPLPFEELFVPLIVRARRQVESRGGGNYARIGAAAHTSMERALLTQLTRICVQALYAAFSLARPPAESRLAALLDPSRVAATRTHYDAFVTSMKRGGLLSFFRHHSVAARLCATTTDNWVTFIGEFLQRLEDDRDALESRLGQGLPFGNVTAADVGLSDAHEGGRGVVIVKFESGARLVYKPRPVALEEFFAELVGWSNEIGRLLPLRCVAVLSRPTHGWVEWVPELPCDDEGGAARFYRRCGMLLAVVHGVHGTDFHRENVLASGEHPVLIDAESMLSHKFGLAPESEQSPPPVVSLYESAMTQPVLRTHLLPFLKFSNGGQAEDLGGLTMVAPSEHTIETRAWKDINTDSMRFAPVRVRAAGNPRNLPTLAGKAITATEHVDDVVAGFREMYEQVLARRDDLLAPGGLVDRLGPQAVRFLFRHTSLYAALLERTLHPSFLQDGAIRTMELDVLARPLLEVAERPAVWPLLRAERQALEQMDVPLFSARADARSIALPSGELVECFESSAVDEVRRKLLSLSDRDRSLQEDLIRAAFAATAARGLAAAAPAADAAIAPDGPAPADHEVRAEAAREAARIAEAIVPRARREGDLALWMAPVYVASARRHNAGAAASFFDGSGGISVALAAVATLTRRDDLAEAARAGLAPLCGPVAALAPRIARGTLDAGIGTGIASCAYALLRASELLSEPRFLCAARELAALLSADGLPRDASDDLISGRAGALLLLLRLHQVTAEREPLDRALAFAEELLARRKIDRATGLKVWLGRGGQAETGVAHGQSGIAYALATAAAVAGRDDLRDAAREALRHERAVLGADLSGTAADDPIAAWSRGAAGIGLVRAAMLRLSDDEEIRRDLEAAVERTRPHLLAGPDDLCSGVLGRIELLLAAADALTRPTLRAEALAAAGHVLARASRNARYTLGWHARYQHPGLFQGLAGLAFSWARLADPARIRSLALWD